MEWAGIAIRFALYLDLMLACGLAAFALTAPAGTARVMPMRAVLVACGCLGLAISAVGLLVVTASMSGTSVAQVDRETLTMIVDETPYGAAWTIRMVALVLAVGSASTVRGTVSARVRTAASAAAFALAVATLAWGGHGAMSEGALGALHLGADILHLLAAALWMGSLLGLVLLVARPAARMDAGHLDLSWRALHGFSRAGTASVAIIVVTGIVNGWLVLGPDGLSGLTSTLYSQLLLAKLAAFVAMVALASLNRFRLTPALGSVASSGAARREIGALRLSLAFEAALGIAVLALVAWLGTLEPVAAAG
ncbi:copper homeostasis membrane protein CopD [Sphingomonas sp.]|uniref:copper homeostasis membrane protein CopD n=1 Tax=Sphingomonas sp. TaxID=28214 RepID=UPI0025DD461F|nr:copper homeostasis membrane protein CopD [Sphingomonas sp.]